MFNSTKLILMHYKYFLTGVLVAIVLQGTSFAQGILPTSGFVSNGNISLVFSAGETIVGEFGNESISLVVIDVPDLPLIPTSNEVPVDLPKEFGLSQNFPNPFNPSTTIQYALPKASDVSIDVFNILGKRVASLVNQRKAAGSYSIQFQASNLSSGVYFYTLRVGGRVLKSQRMLLIK
ncbi:MAG: T9SS type A sorting domain-containing protein [Balneola sp.]